MEENPEENKLPVSWSDPFFLFYYSLLADKGSSLLMPVHSWSDGKRTIHHRPVCIVRHPFIYPGRSSRGFNNDNDVMIIWTDEREKEINAIFLRLFQTHLSCIIFKDPLNHLRVPAVFQRTRCFWNKPHRFTAGPQRIQCIHSKTMHLIALYLDFRY